MYFLSYKSHFNPRSHERSDGGLIGNQLIIKLFQSTLPREERLSVIDDDLSSDDISIHAPTRGATQV